MRTTLASLVVVAGAAVFAACSRSPAPAPARAPSSADAPGAAARSAPRKEAPPLAPDAIDAAIREAWSAAGVKPAPRADDATFLRRAYVDVVGTIPDPDAVAAFLADSSPDKRRKLVDALLDSPAYADHWMNYWDDVLMGRNVKSAAVDRVAFRAWLRARFQENAPWDRVVRDLVAAIGQNSEGGARVGLPKALAMQPAPASGMMTADPADDGRDDGPDDGERGAARATGAGAINPAVNWTLRFQQAPLDLAGDASRVFLGVQIQCAQCHDHKTEKWKQADFRSFAAAFLHTRAVPMDRGKKRGLERVELLDLDRVAPRFARKPDLAPVAKSKATALDGEDLEKGRGTRKALAAWMTAKENPWFARAFVNRMWGHFLGRGFSDPVDDMRASNPPVLAPVLDRLAQDFAANGFDVKRLIRTIASTEVYQLAAASPAAGAAEAGNVLWARFHLVPLGPEELLNALVRATNVEATAERLGIRNMDQLRLQLVRQYVFLFDVDEETDVPDYSGTVSQALALLNGQLTGQGARDLPGSALDAILTKPGTDAQHVEDLFVRVLAREPTAQESARWTSYVQSASRAPAGAGAARPRRARRAGPLGRLANRRSDPRRAAYEDVLWAMLNSSEFVFNH
jgi:hypothetical protein